MLTECASPAIIYSPLSGSDHAPRLPYSSCRVPPPDKLCQRYSKYLHQSAVAPQHTVVLPSAPIGSPTFITPVLPCKPCSA
ncbi:hypothetical protein FKM82_028666 [Ascaphus truei]